jgi:hypothetical protein
VQLNPKLPVSTVSISDQVRTMTTQLKGFEELRAASRYAVGPVSIRPAITSVAHQAAAAKLGPQMNIPQLRRR